jgi:transposase
MIRLDAMWLSASPVDMRADADRLLAVVVTTLGLPRAHHGYLFANAPATRIKLFVHDGFGVWCAAQRLNAGRFLWLPAASATPAALELTRARPGAGTALGAAARDEREITKA